MRGDSVCWGEDWEALGPDVSCDTPTGERDPDTDSEREWNSSTKCPLLNPSVRRCVHVNVHAFLQCVCVCVILRGEVI